jgi:hypothetical protein
LDIKDRQPMTRPRRRSRALVVALYLNAGLLALIAVVLLSRPGSPGILPELPAAFGQNQPAFAGGAGLFVVPGQFASNTYGCYLMDVDAQTLCAYQWFPGEKKFRLVAARSFRYDRLLGEFNTDSPAPPEVKALLDKQKEELRGKAK